MDRKLIPVWLAAAVLAGGGLLAGCGESGDGAFKSYSELESANGPSGTSVDSTPADSAPAAPPARELPDGSAARDERVAISDVNDANAAAQGTGRAATEGATRDPAEAPQPGSAADLVSPVGVSESANGLTEPAPASEHEASAERMALLQRAAAEVPVEAPRPEPREIKLLVPFREFRVEGPEGAIRVSYDDIDLLKVLNMEPVRPDCVAYFPDWLRSLDGRRIRIRGFMYPPFETTGIRGFVLARDNQICCFGRDPKRYDVIDVFLRRGVTTDYIQNRPFDVGGVFHIQPEADDGELYQLYVIDDAEVIDR